MPTDPIQTTGVNRSHGESAHLSRAVTARAYEVYAHLYGSRQTLERLNERGGFHLSELIAFLHARSFPRDEWAQRVKEAERDMYLSGWRAQT